MAIVVHFLCTEKQEWCKSAKSKSKIQEQNLHHRAIPSEKHIYPAEITTQEVRVRELGLSRAIFDNQ